MKFFERIKQFFQSKRARPLKWLVYGLVGLVLVIIIGLVSLYFLLKTSSLTEQGVLKARPYLAPLGIDLIRLDALSIDAFQSISVSNLHLKWRDSAKGSVSIKLGKLDARYTLSDILNNKFDLSLLHVKDVSIAGDLSISDTPAAVPKQSDPFSLLEIEEMLRSIPVALNVNKMLIENIEVDLVVNQANQIVTIDHQLELFEASLRMSHEAMMGRYLISLNHDDGIVSARQVTDGVKASVNFNPTLNLSGSWDISYRDNVWHLEEFTLTNGLQLKHLSANQENRVVISGEEIAIDLITRITSAKKLAKSTGIDKLFPLNLENSLKLNWSKLEFDEPDLGDVQLAAISNNSLDINSSIQVDSLFSVVDDFDVRLKESLDLQKFRYESANENIATSNSNLFWSLWLSGTRKTDSAQLIVDSNLQFSSAPINYQQANTTLSLTPEIKTHIKGSAEIYENTTAKDINSITRGMELNFSHSMKVNDFRLREGGVDKASFNEGLVNIDAEFKEGEMNLTVDKGVDKIKLDGFTKNFSLDSEFKLLSNLALNDATIYLTTDFNRQTLLQSDLQLTNRENRFELGYRFDINMPQNLDNTIPAAKELYALGLYNINTDGLLSFTHKKKTVLDVSFEEPTQLNVALNGNLQLKQLRAPKDNSLLLKKPLKFKYQLSQDKGYTVDLNVSTEGVKVPPLLKALPINIQSRSKFSWPLLQLESAGSVNISSDTLFNYDLNLANQKNKFTTVGSFSVKAKPEWDQYIAELSELRTLGEFEVETDMSIELEHSQDTALALTNDHLKEIKLGLTLDTKITQRKRPDDAVVKLSKPISIRKQLDWTLGRANLLVDFKVPDLQMSEITTKELAGNLKVTTDHGYNPSSINTEFKLSQISLFMEQLAADLGPMITPTNLNVSVTGLLDDSIQLNNLQLDIGEKLLSISATGSASKNGKDAQMEGNIVFRPYKNMLLKPQLSGLGELTLPVNFTLFNGNQLSFDGAVEFQDFSLKTDGFKLTRANGRINYNEALKINNEQASYVYYLKINPFQRVDYRRIQSFLDAPAITVQKIEVGDKAMGPLLINLSLNQNLLRMQRFDVSLFDGHVSGQFYLDTTPRAWKVGLLSRMTGVDLRKMFPANDYVQATEYSPMNLRIALAFDVQEKLLEGRIDISTIKRDQLLQLLEFVDPDHVDEQIDSLRSMIGAAHPDSVAIEMSQGLMNVEVSISISPKPIRITGIPLSTMLQQFAEDMLAIETQFPIH